MVGIRARFVAESGLELGLGLGLGLRIAVAVAVAVAVTVRVRVTRYTKDREALTRRSWSQCS